MVMELENCEMAYVNFWMAIPEKRDMNLQTRRMAEKASP
jgi:hypothetical protein